MNLSESYKKRLCELAGLNESKDWVDKTSNYGNLKDLLDNFGASDWSYKEGTGEDLLETKTIENSDLKFDIQGNTINFTDSLGGYGFLVKNGDEIKIVDWNSVPLNKKYSQEESQYKRRGFARKVIQAIKKMGYKQFTINMPSNEATAALNKLSQDGFITPIPESKRGVSIAPYYTKFIIN